MGHFPAALVDTPKHQEWVENMKFDLGGQIRWASKGQYNEEFFQTARYRIHAVKSAGVKLELGKMVTVDDVKEFRPDVVVVATGSTPLVPDIKGVDLPGVVQAVDVLLEFLVVLNFLVYFP